MEKFIQLEGLSFDKNRKSWRQMVHCGNKVIKHVNNGLNKGQSNELLNVNMKNGKKTNICERVCDKPCYLVGLTP